MLLHRWPRRRFNLISKLGMEKGESQMGGNGSLTQVSHVQFS